MSVLSSMFQNSLQNIVNTGKEGILRKMGCSVFVKCVVGFALKRLSQLKMYSSFIPEKLIPPRALKFDYSIIIIND